MNSIKLTLGDETAEVLRQIAGLTGLYGGDIIAQTLGPIEAGWHEVLALVGSHPEMRDKAANLIISFGPESIEAGIRSIAPVGYETLAARFAREIGEAIPASRVAHE
ncbi:hypothetical protein GCM10027277_26930 [Pseudoduganella ginsengisoli]|uniref:Uncharacterized protein n=1 Tax=Pseudoduganella ginsengisoli TaxID=1462440 RepID=A0A6L6Q1J1_9BURK|nr:hypothetical protein [Pseudoduganella ginsengisoli]MTW03500.1 hypothetical protein [Pseudoduganella ginsengisoli]